MQTFDNVINAFHYHGHETREGLNDLKNIKDDGGFNRNDVNRGELLRNLFADSSNAEEIKHILDVIWGEWKQGRGNEALEHFNDRRYDSSSNYNSADALRRTAGR